MIIIYLIPFLIMPISTFGIMVPDVTTRSLQKQAELLTEQLEKFNKLYLTTLDQKMTSVTKTLTALDANLKTLQEKAHVWDIFRHHIDAWNDNMKTLDHKIDLIKRTQDSHQSIENKLPVLEFTLNHILTKVDQIHVKTQERIPSFEQKLNELNRIVVNWEQMSIVDKKDVATRLNNILKRVINIENGNCRQARSARLAALATPVGMSVATILKDMEIRLDKLVDTLSEEDIKQLIVVGKQNTETLEEILDLTRGVDDRTIKVLDVQNDHSSKLESYCKATSNELSTFTESADLLLKKIEKIVLAMREKAAKVPKIASKEDKDSKSSESDSNDSDNSKDLDDSKDSDESKDSDSDSSESDESKSKDSDDSKDSDESKDSDSDSSDSDDSKSKDNSKSDDDDDSDDSSSSSSSSSESDENNTKEKVGKNKKKDSRKKTDSTKKTTPGSSNEDSDDSSSGTNRSSSSSEEDSTGFVQPTKDGCHDLKAPKPEGVYKFEDLIINTSGRDYNERYCSFPTSGPGWTVIQRRGPYDKQENFNRSWVDYKNGFGDLSKDFWFGLEFMHRLTDTTPYVLRIELEDFENQKAWAEYSYFRISPEKDNYALTIGEYRGNASDSLAYHAFARFSTYDKNNDNTEHPCCPCAPGYGSGWWYDNCSDANLNGIYRTKPKGHDYIGVIWEKWHGDYSLKKARMLIRPLHNDSDDSSSPEVPEDP